MPEMPYGDGAIQPPRTACMIEFIVRLIKDVPEQFTLLDVGCGKGVLGYILRALYGFKKLRLIGIDVAKHGQYFDIMSGVYDEVIYSQINKVIPGIIRRKERYDVLVASHVLEHVLEKEGYSLIKRFKRISDNVLLAFPEPKKNHIYKQDGGINGHKWGYSQEKLEKLNFVRVWGIENDHVYLWTNRELPYPERIAKYIRKKKPKRRGLFS